jgi:glycosyltransferase involved in cell wall biosynthesis
MNPKVSIIIPVYNGEKYMKEAIDSALAQTYDNCEVIVVNDGSTDHTEAIAKSYGDKIRYFSKENGGVSSALNVGIENMEGEYFAWLSHDDVYYPEKIQKQLQALQEAGDMKAPLYGSADGLLMPEGKVKHPYPEYRYSLEDRINGVFPVLFGLVNGCTVLIHKSHFERVGLFDEKLLTAQDVDMWFRIFRNQKLVYVEEPLIKYRFHEAQGSKVIKEFQSNCQEIQMDMIGRLEQEEINNLFGGYYKFYFDMTRMAEDVKWESCFKKLYQLFLDSEEPEKDEDVCFRLKKKTDGRLILYCAGKNGRRLLKELAFRGVAVDLFADRDSKLWGTKIDGVKCVSPEEMRKEDYIIVTKDYPEEIVGRLIREGYVYVESYGKVAHDVYVSMPEKMLVQRFYSV